MFVWFFSFFKKFVGVYLLSLRPNLGFTFSLVITSWLIHLCALFIKFSTGTYRTWLIEHGGYEVAYPSHVNLDITQYSLSTILWYSFLSLSGSKFIVFLFSMRGKTSQSLERFFRNAKWLEKETGEMHDWYFSLKRDRRALFLMPLLYWAPLRKVFPASGFYELRLNSKDGTLYPVHISWLD